FLIFSEQRSCQTLTSVNQSVSPAPTGPRKVRLKVRTNRRVKVLSGREHWPVRSGRELRRREAGGRAAGSESPGHKHNNVELDSAKMHWRACFSVAKPRPETVP